MSRLVPWDTPFAGAFYPSVISAFAQSFERSADSLMVVIGLGESYPRYLIDFENVLVAHSLDEACAPQLPFPESQVSSVRSCSWQWLDSPTIKSYQGCHYTADGEEAEILHFLIFGGDHIVEVVTKSQPLIAKVTEPRVINLVFNL